MDLSERFRPARFADFWQWPVSAALRIITSQIAHNKFQSPLLVIAAYGLGKTTVSRVLGARACCRKAEEHAFEPCRNCEGCNSVSVTGTTFDSDYGYVEIDCTQFKAPKVREIITRETWGRIYKSSLGRPVICLDEIGRCPPAFQRQLLKVVENCDAHFVLCAGIDDAIDTALAQRCALRRLAAPTPDQCTSALTHITNVENININQIALEHLVTRSACNPRRILKTLDSVRAISDAAITTKEIDEVLA